MAESRHEPRERRPSVGRFKPGEALGPNEHHLGWNRALQQALDQLQWPPGNFDDRRVIFSANIHSYNPGSITEYIVTII